MRQNRETAAREQQRNGRGPIYAHLLAGEVQQDRRFGRVGNMRRPRHLLEALQAGEAVTVPAWGIPLEWRPPGCGPTLVVTQDM